MQQILKSLIKNGCIQDLDISKTGVNNDAQVMNLVAEMITKNKNLRTLNLQRLALNDSTIMALVEPLSQSLNVENLFLDYNNLGDTFIFSLVEKL